MKKLITSLLGLFLLLGSTSPVAAAPLPSVISGSIGYTAYSAVQRTATVSAISKNKACSYSWHITNPYVLAFKLDPDTITTYSHDATFTQSGSSITGNGGNPVGGPFAYAWHVTSGTISTNTVNLTILYDTGAPGTIMTMMGTIAPDGSMSGTWTDNFGGIRTGTWATTSGAAAKTYGAGCIAKGVFNYSDAAGNYYFVNVKYMTTVGDKGWIAGPVMWGNVGLGSWLFAEVKDGGLPGAGVDQIWGSFTTETAAKAGVASMSNPMDGPFTATSGDMLVH